MVLEKIFDMGSEGKDSLISRCHPICVLPGNLASKAVFVKSVKKGSEIENVYYCGLGIKGCVIADYVRQIYETKQLAKEAKQLAEKAFHDSKTYI